MKKRHMLAKFFSISLIAGILSVVPAYAEGTYISELTGMELDASLQDMRPIAVMIDNELYALDHFGTNQADIIYEIMNSTANGRITRLMAIYKDWRNLSQIGSIRSTRSTNFMLAAEYDAILCHDGGPFYIDEYVARDYTTNVSGGFARIPNGKSMEFTEYVTADAYTNSNGSSFAGLKDRLIQNGISETYTPFYQGAQFSFNAEDTKLSSMFSAGSAVSVSLPFEHNSSKLLYNSDLGKYEYYEYGDPHIDALDGTVTSFENVIIQNCDYTLLDQNGYMVYNLATSSVHNGYYLTNGESIPITWNKESESSRTFYVNAATGENVVLNPGKTYIAIVPSDVWDSLSIQ